MNNKNTYRCQKSSFLRSAYSNAGQSGVMCPVATRWRQRLKRMASESQHTAENTVLMIFTRYRSNSWKQTNKQKN